MKIRPEIPGLGRVRPAANTFAFVALLVSALHAATLPAPAKNLGDLSIEELMNESVTSVSKRQQKLGDVASAITVLSNEDLRRSGATSIAEAMRLVPGMDVGSVNAREWAVSSRGFNGVFANKLLDDPKAVPEVSKTDRPGVLAAIARDVRAVSMTLGILRRSPSEFLIGRRDRLCRRRRIDAAAVERSIAARAEARAARDFARADEVRKALQEQGVELMDTPAGTTWRVV